ncbi:Uncharacterized protein SCF082_LOCUS26538 [Durusdinium trenchii]|uniref:RNA-dependent RNA polymerase n=1 Tax=Durusdinium trenchii TaxID=1381693 RepID=A0ABP0M749_9DINO
MRIRRMVQPHKTRKELNVPPAVRDKWDESPEAKDMMAAVLKKVNFDKGDLGVAIPEGAFDGLDVMERRLAAEPQPANAGGGGGGEGKAYKDQFKTFMDSILQKSGKLRGLKRVLAEDYDASDKSVQQGDVSGSQDPVPSLVTQSKGLLEILGKESKPEVPCKHAVSSAKNIIKDIGTEVAERLSGGLVKFSSSNWGNHERDAHRQFKKLKLRLPIQLANVRPKENGQKTFKALRLRDWLAFFLERNLWHQLAGLSQPNEHREECIWEQFWELYRQEAPQHEIFQLAARGEISLRRTCAVCFHGDEGRGKKKTPFFVCSFRSFLGKGSDVAAKHRMSTGSKGKQPFCRMKVNVKGHVFTTRLLCGVLPKAQYQQNEAWLQDLFAFAASEAEYVLRHGMQAPNGKTYRMALCGVSGDWPFLAKVGSLDRSFAALPKKLRTKNGDLAQCRGICHICLAGKCNGGRPSPWPFEDLARDTPSWIDTMGDESPFKKLPHFARVAHTEGQLEDLFRYDIFHTWHLGIGKTFMSSAITLASWYFPGTTLEERFGNLSQAVLSWCRLNHEHLYITHISKDTVNWDANEFPTGGWSKGSTTTVLARWFAAWSLEVETSDGLFIATRRAAACINEFLTGLFQEDDVWLSSAVATRVGQKGVEFLHHYVSAAVLAYRGNRFLFPFMPKHHAFQHLCLVDLVLKARKQSHVLSPLVFSTQMDEDFIGRQSRTSRRVHASTVIERVTLRYLTLAHAEFVRAGFLCDS